MDKQYQMVAQFHEACSVSMPNMPTMLSNEGHRYTTLNSFAFELEGLTNRMKFSSANGFGGEVLARASYMLEEVAEFTRATTLEDQADALIDLIYFALGTFTSMGVKPERIFDIVHSANMRKVVDGKVLRNEQNKIMKPEGWYGPEEAIKNEIEQQAKSAECEVCNGTVKKIYGLECECQ